MSINSHKLGRNISADQKFDQILVQSIWYGSKLFFLCFSVRLSPYPMDNRVSALSSGGAGRGSAKHLTSASSGGRAASPKSLKASGLHQLQQQQGGFASQQSAVGGRIRRPTEQDEGRIRIGLSKSISHFAIGSFLVSDGEEVDLNGSGDGDADDDCCGRDCWPWFLQDRPVLRLFLIMFVNGLVSMLCAAIFIGKFKKTIAKKKLKFD